MPQPIKKAVIPVAGLGTRFLPATKAVPKEMMNIVDRPMLQFIVDEALEAGIEHICFVTGRNKQVIEDYFDTAFELEATLEARGASKKKILDEVRAQTPRAGSMTFTRQQAPLGLGHAVWCARDVVGDEPFAVLLPDMLMSGETGCLKQMMDVYEATGGNIVSVEECLPEEADKYGIVSIATREDTHFEITGMVEKPEKGTAPSNFFLNGRYILDNSVMQKLTTQEPGAGGEIQLTDSMLALMGDQSFYGVPFAGETYDCGNKMGFVTANIKMALKDTDIGDGVRALIASVN
ncbi:MAG: UTP--glucose-1-phosphate uridylyltransferase GalU [Pseudomonadota bacterium]